MPRKRMIDPEFWSDEEIGQWSDSAKLFYIALWNFADDEGRLKAHPDLLKAQIFPYNPKVDISKLKTMVASKVQWYEIDGCQYGFVRNFHKHQSLDRPSKSKLPSPPPLDESSMSTRRILAQKRIEEKRKEEKRKDAPTPQDFISRLKANPVYKHIDIDRELGKMDAWLMVHKGRMKTERFIVNWLNKIDKVVVAPKPIDTQMDKNREEIKRREAEAVPPPPEFKALLGRIGNPKPVQGKE